MDESLDSSLLKTSDEVLEELCTANMASPSVDTPSSAMATPTPDLPEVGTAWANCQEAQLRTLAPLWETVPFGTPNPQVQSLVSRSDTEASDLNSSCNGSGTLTRQHTLTAPAPLSPLPPRSPVAPVRSSKVRQSPISPAHTKLDDLGEMVTSEAAALAASSPTSNNLEMRNLLSEVDERIKISLDIDQEANMRNSLSQVRRDLTDLKTDIVEAKHDLYTKKKGMLDMVERLTAQEPQQVSRFPKANTCFPPPSRPQPFRPTNRDLAAETEVTLASLHRDLNKPIFQRPLSRPWEKERSSLDTTRQFR